MLWQRKKGTQSAVCSFRAPKVYLHLTVCDSFSSHRRRRRVERIQSDSYLFFIIIIILLVITCRLSVSNLANVVHLRRAKVQTQSKKVCINLNDIHVSRRLTNTKLLCNFSFQLLCANCSSFGVSVSLGVLDQSQQRE